jgi:hypothetical protein
MAERAKAVIVLTAGKPIEAQAPVEEIRKLLADAPQGEVSFFKITDTRGDEHWVNARQVVDIHGPPDKSIGFA